MLQLFARSGAGRVRTSYCHLDGIASIAKHNVAAFRVVVSRRPFTTSPLHAQQEAVARVNIEDMGDGYLHHDQKEAVPGGDPYWQKLDLWKDVPEDKFLSYQWQVSMSPAIHAHSLTIIDQEHGSRREQVASVPCRCSP